MNCRIARHVFRTTENAEKGSKLYRKQLGDRFLIVQLENYENKKESTTKSAAFYVAKNPTRNNYLANKQVIPEVLKQIKKVAQVL
jgi:hypothetical protein